MKLRLRPNAKVLSREELEEVHRGRDQLRTLMLDHPPKYLPKWMSNEGILAYRFIQTCDAEGIPESKRPKFTIDLPNARFHMQPLVFRAAPHDILADRRELYRKLARAAFDEHLDAFFEDVDRQIELQVKAGVLVPGDHQPPRKGKQIAPFELRVRWAVLHHCDDRSYGELHQSANLNPSGKYSLDQITRAVQRILEDLGLKQHRSRSNTAGSL